jgi:hypothetical protein
MIGYIRWIYQMDISDGYIKWIYENFGDEGDCSGVRLWICIFG